MGKKDLKKQYPELDISLIDYLSRFDPSGTNKYLPFLLKVVSEKIKLLDGIRLTKKNIGKYDKTSIDRQFNTLFCYIIDVQEPFKVLESFHKHLTENRIDNTDISSYKSFDEILSENNKAEIKFLEKDLKNEIERVYEDDTWLVIKPLSFKASKIYGSNTRWCTTMEHEPMYFYKYSRGILIYVLNKKTNNKYGFYSGDDEYSVWNSADVRIDSLMTDIPFDILKVLQESLDLNKNIKNRFLFSESEMETFNSYFGGEVLVNKNTLPDIPEDLVYEEHDRPSEEMLYESEEMLYESEPTMPQTNESGGVSMF